MFMFSLSAFKHLLIEYLCSLLRNPYSKRAPLLIRRRYQADACLPLCRNASSSALIWSFKVGPRRISLCVPVPRLWFSRDPLACVCWAILERDVVLFATLAKFRNRALGFAEEGI